MSKAKVWVICPDCGEKRQVLNTNARKPTFTGRCRHCANVRVGESRKRQTEIICPGCGTIRMVPTRKARSPTFTGYCKQCAPRCLKPKLRGNYRSGLESLPNGNQILWDTLQSRDVGTPPRRKMAVQVYCCDCDDFRWEVASRITQRRWNYTGYCQMHWREHCPRGTKSFGWTGGRFKTAEGYVYVHLATLPEEHKALAQSMQTQTAYVLEHRLNMAIHLNRPLLSHEIVDHRYGIRDDNRVENLRLKTTKTHRPGHGDPYYQLWQEAEARCFDLEATVDQILSDVFS